MNKAFWILLILFALAKLATFIVDHYELLYNPYNGIIQDRGAVPLASTKFYQGGELVSTVQGRYTDSTEKNDGSVINHSKHKRKRLRSCDCCLISSQGFGSFPRNRINYRLFAGLAQSAEHLLAKQKAKGSSPLTRSIRENFFLVYPRPLCYNGYTKVMKDILSHILIFIGDFVYDYDARNTQSRTKECS